MAKKMILVDPRLLESMNQKTYVPPNPLTDSLRDLDTQMQQLLDREDLSPRDKVTQYQQLLQRYTTRLNEYRHKPLGLIDMKPTPPLPDPAKTQPTSDQPHQTIEVTETPKRETISESLDTPKQTDSSPPAKRTRGKKKKSKLPTPIKWENWQQTKH